MKTEQVREHFRLQVPSYSGLMQRLIPFYDLQRELILDLMPRNRTRPLRVLDLGCGPGLMAAGILAEFPQAELTLIDFTREMIDECRCRLGGYDRIHYRVADFGTDDFGDGYDVILASLSLHHLDLAERPEFARRAFRGLVPGGQLISAEVIVDESPSVRDLQYELWRRFMTARGEDGDVWYQKHLAKDHPIEIMPWLTSLSAAGFTSAGCFWRYLNFAIIGAYRPAV